MGKVRHLDCTDLRIQEKIGSKQISLEKVLGTDNPADMLTKYVDHATLTAALQKLNMKVMRGRPSAAPAAMGIHSQKDDKVYGCGIRMHVCVVCLWQAKQATM